MDPFLSFCRPDRRTVQSVCVISVALGIIGGPVLAQTPPAATAPDNAAASQTIRLALRGRPGDSFAYKANEHSDGDLKAGNGAMQIYVEERKQQSYTLRVRGTAPNKALQIEIHNLGGQSVKENNGDHSTQTLPPGSALYTLSPEDRILHAIGLGAAGTAGAHPARRRGAKLASAASSRHAAQGLHRADDVFAPNPFPDTPVHVGDTWTGTFPLNRFAVNGQENASPPSYTATLLAIETHRGVPCAKVEYKLEYDGDIPGVTESIRKQLPEGSSLEGTAKLAGTLTAFYTLDRGMVLDSERALQITLDYQVSVQDPNSGQMQNVDLEGTLTDSEQQTATKFPPPNAYLMGAN